VGALIDGSLAARLLGRHVRGRPEYGAGERRGFVAIGGLELRHAEVEHLDEIGAVLAPARKQILRLEIAMDDAGGVCGLNSTRRLPYEVGCALERKRPAPLEERLDALADEVLEDDEGCAVRRDAEIDRCGEVLAFERSGCLGFALEAREALALFGEL